VKKNNRGGGENHQEFARREDELCFSLQREKQGSRPPAS
jgi:hypothetical protein